MCYDRLEEGCSDSSITTGVLTQFAIVIGIMVTQAMGLKLATPEDWRLVLLFSSALSGVQAMLSPFIVESPTWLHRHGLLQEKAAAARKLWAIGDAPSIDSHSQYHHFLAASRKLTILQ